MQKRFRREDEEVYSECIKLEMSLRFQHGDIKNGAEVRFKK